MLTITPAMRAQMDLINRSVNAIKYVTDLDRYDREEFWTLIDDKGGDCEDYALQKRRRLLDAGWPIEALRLAVCRVEDGSGHAVLTIDTDKGTLVLDNRFPRVIGIDAIRSKGYRFDRRQTAGGTGWVKTR